MFYVVLVLVLITACLAAQLCVCLFARIEARWRRRLSFWTLWVPISLAVSVFLFSFAADDLIFFQSPHYVIGLSAPLCIFNLTLLFSALKGFRTNKESGIPQARSWNAWRSGKRLLTAAALLVVATFLFDLQLRCQLSNLKAATLAESESRPPTLVADEDNAALVALELENSRSLLMEWNARLEDFRLREFDSADPDLAELHECEPAFAIIRKAAEKPAWQLPDNQFAHALLQDDEHVRLLQRTLRLFALHLLTRAERGDTSDIDDNLQSLRQTAAHLTADSATMNLLRGAQAWHMTRATLERLLQSDSLPSNPVLRSLIDEQHNPRRILPEAFSRSKTTFTTMLCDLYLGQLNDEQLKEMGLQNISEMPPPLRAVGHFLDRITKAHDDLIALQWQSEVFDAFAARLSDSTATTDALLDNFRLRIPRGTTLLNADNRHTIFYSVVAISDTQQLINLMAAATLYRREHGTYPIEIGDLIPTYLTAVPISLTDGQAYRLKPAGDGLVIYSTEDSREVESELSNAGFIRRGSARSLTSTALLGDAFR